MQTLVAGNVHINITFRCICVTTVAMQKQEVLHIVCVFKPYV